MGKTINTIRAEADSLYDPLGVERRPGCMEDGQGRGTRRIQGGSAIKALKKAAVWLVWDTCWELRA